jgi:hypothetical protein
MKYPIKYRDAKSNCCNDDVYTKDLNSLPYCNKCKETITEFKVKLNLDKWKSKRGSSCLKKK